MARTGLKFWIATALLATAGACHAQHNSLLDDVRALVDTSKLEQARTAVSLREVETGTVLADYNADQPLIPASNMKLLSSGAALMVLGPEFAFRTEVILDGDRLVVRGSGDPALADPELLSQMKPRLTVGDVLDVMAGAVAKAGVSQVSEVVIDDRVFDRVFVHPSWPTDKLDRGYSAQVAGLNFHANVILAFPRPSPDGPGVPPPVSLQPDAPWLPLANKARTIAAGKNSVWLSREPEANRFTIHGEVKYPTQVGVEITVHNPPEFFGMLLTDELSRKGVRVLGDTRAPGAPPAGSRLAGPTEVFAAGRVLAAVSTPMSEVLKRCNSDSANLYAECLLKRSGNAVTREPGTWENGGSVLRMLLSQKLGASMAAKVSIADGCGLSRDDAVPAGVLTKWLEVIAKDDQVCDMFTESLATPGQGTLKERFRKTPPRNRVYAKSGFINGVRTLSGYVVDPDSGRRIAFSVMVNDIKTDTQTIAAKELHEQVVALADRWLTRRAGPRQGG